MIIKHCDYIIPVQNGETIQLPTRMSILSDIQSNDRDCEISITTSVGERDYLITVDHNMGWSGLRHYKNGNKLPKKYNEFVSILMQDHLKNFPEITLEVKGE